MYAILIFVSLEKKYGKKLEDHSAKILKHDRIMTAGPPSIAMATQKRIKLTFFGSKKRQSASEVGMDSFTRQFRESKKSRKKFFSVLLWSPERPLCHMRLEGT